MARTLRILAALIALIGFSWSQAHAQVPLTGAGVGSPGVACTATQLNNSDKSAGITLSNGNLTATDSGASYQGVRAIASALAGKKYWEVHADTISSPAANVVEGAGNATATLTTFLGDAGRNSVGWAGDGKVYFDGASVTIIQGWAQGNTLSFAYDIDNSKIWFRTNGGNWNNDILANQNPATNTGGVNLSTMNPGPYFAAVQGVTSGDVLTANFGCSFTQSVPSGFSKW